MAERAGTAPGARAATPASGRGASGWGPSELADLLEVSQSLAATPTPKAAMGRVLDLLGERHGALSSAVMLVDEAAGELSIEAAAGLDRGTVRSARYRPGEGITGRVVQSGRPIVLPRVGREPLFLSRAGSPGRSRRADVAHVCVPVMIGAKAVGALGVSLARRAKRELEEEARFLAAVAAMLGQALRAHRLADSERDRLIRENQRLRQDLVARYDVRNIVGNSRPMREVYRQITRAASTEATVLIRGEPGTGKGMVARAIHSGSARAGEPFLELSCGALPHSLVESELFGHEAEGAPAERLRSRGLLELAPGGTLFLDQVGELSLSAQTRLLRILRRGELERSGDFEPTRVNVRLIAAADEALELAVEDGGFREDLYSQLGACSLCLPPLRERHADVLLLLDHFVEKYAAQHGRSVKRVATTAIDAVLSHHWPGNVRELEDCVERAVLACGGGVLHAHHLPLTLQTAESSGALPEGSLGAAVEALERDLLVDALKSARGSRARAARLLSATQRIVGYKIKKYGIDCERFKGPRIDRR